MSHGIVVGVARWLEKSVHANTDRPRMKSYIIPSYPSQ